MSEQKVETALREIKAVLDKHFEPGWLNYGPVRVKRAEILDNRRKVRQHLTIEAGWDENYGGTITIEASPTGKVLHLWVSKEVEIHEN